jgi:hypothetical protein
MKSVVTVIGLATALLSTSAISATYTFQQGVNGYTSSQDTNLRGADPSFADGSGDEVSVDASDGGEPSQILISFADIFGNGANQIKPTDLITSATLNVEVTSAGSGFNVHNLLVGWSQATASWDSFAGGVSANGIEASVSAVSSYGADNGTSNISSGPFSIDVLASLQAWQANPSSNQGWALLPWMPNGTNGIDFYTSEYADISLRPLLTVEVSPIPEPASIAMLLAGMGLVAARARKSK